MSNTVHSIRAATSSHLGKWHRAYGRVLCYVLLAVLPLIIAKLEAHEALGDIEPIEWVRLFFKSLLATVAVVISFLDKTATQISEHKPT